MPIEVVPELSAIASRPCARSIRALAPTLAEEAERVADLGCGYLAGTRELLRHHASVYAIDTSLQARRVSAHLHDVERHARFAGFRIFDDFRHTRLRLGGVYVINVLHVLPTIESRIEVLRAAARNLRSDGFVVVDVPYYEHYYRDRLTPDRAFGDGFVFKHGQRYTFYRFTTQDELDAWAGDAGLRFDRRHVDHHHWVRIYRLDAAVR